MIPSQLRFSVRFYLFAALVSAAFFFGTTCGQRTATGDALTQHKADSIAYVRLRDSLMQEVMQAETRRIHADRKADSLALISDSLSRHVQATVERVPRIRVVPDSTPDMVGVCIGEDECYPAHRKIAEVTAALDSLLHLEVVGKLIPAYDSALVAERDAKRAVAVERNLEREARKAAEARIAQLERTVAALRPSTWDRAKPYVFGTLGVILGAAVAR